MTSEVVRRDGSTLIYLGKRSYEHRYAVVGWHNSEGPFFRPPFKMIEVTYYTRTGPYHKGWRFGLPRHRRRGPFVSFVWARRNWAELLIGWQSG